MIRAAEGVLGLLLVCTGVALCFSWPAALIVAGGLVLIDRMT